MIPSSDWAVPRSGGVPRTVTSSRASTIARPTSIIACEPGVREERPSAGLSGGRFLHEMQTVLDLLLLLVEVEEVQVLLDRRADGCSKASRSTRRFWIMPSIWPALRAA